MGKLKDKFFQEACDEYAKRLSSHCKLQIIELPAIALSDNPSQNEIAAALEKEATAIIKKIPKQASIYPLCIEGRQLSSEDLATELKSNALSGQPDAVFIIGSSYGLSDEVKRLGKLKLSMSKMTFPHRLARVMLLEQIYRAFRINGGGKYHK